jgi:hypothetical protein
MLDDLVINVVILLQTIADIVAAGQRRSHGAPLIVEEDVYTQFRCFRRIQSDRLLSQSHYR